MSQPPSISPQMPAKGAGHLEGVRIAGKRELVICPEGWRLYERWRVLVETSGSDEDLIQIAWEEFQAHRKCCADCFEKEPL